MKDWVLAGLGGWWLRLWEVREETVLLIEIHCCIRDKQSSWRTFSRKGVVAFHEGVLLLLILAEATLWLFKLCLCGKKSAHSPAASMHR
jgi:hypothetical protein